jgi:integrase
LRSSHFIQLFAVLREDGGRRGGPLSERSIQYTHSIARVALESAVETGLLALNPAAAVPRTARPKPNTPEMTTWTASEAATFIRHCATDRLLPLWALALDAGLRRGELLGLRWVDLNLDDAVIAVRRNRVLANNRTVENTPKSSRARTISIAEPTAALLRRWQTRTQKEERLAAGAAYAASGYVFVDALGAPLRPDTVSWQWERAVAAAPVPRIRLHDARHTSATLDLAAGTHPKVVQEKLGHANISLTLGLYSHVLPGMQEAAAAARGTLLYGDAAG